MTDKEQMLLLDSLRTFPEAVIYTIVDNRYDKTLQPARDSVDLLLASGMRQKDILRALGYKPRYYIASFPYAGRVSVAFPHLKLFGVARQTPSNFKWDDKTFEYLKPTPSMMNTAHSGMISSYIKAYYNTVLIPNLDRLDDELDDNYCFFCHCPAGLSYCHKRLIGDELGLRGWVMYAASL